jgi:hypothetical protein
VSEVVRGEQGGVIVDEVRPLRREISVWKSRFLAKCYGAPHTRVPIREVHAAAMSTTRQYIHGIALLTLACCLAFSVLRPSSAHAQQETGGTHRDGTQAIRPDTQWPAPTELRLEQSVGVTNADGSFIPPEQREAVSSLTWSAVPGFTGTYVLERARVPSGSTEPRQWEAFANVSATWFVDEPYPFLDLLAYQRCYRVATVVDGQAGAFSTEACTVVPPSSDPEPAGEPPFNFDEVKEVVVPLIGDDGRTHYVTLSEDSAGIVRIRLSLFDFQPSTYRVVIFRRGNCSETASYGPDDVIRPDFPLTLDSREGLVLQFYNTDSITLLPGPKSIYDADGTSLAVYRPGSGGSGLLAACAVLSAPPGAPNTGTGATAADEASIDDRGAGFIAAGLCLVAAPVLFALRRRAVRA